jgi:hypothetical protein
MLARRGAHFTFDAESFRRFVLSHFVGRVVDRVPDLFTRREGPGGGGTHNPWK